MNGSFNNIHQNKVQIFNIAWKDFQVPIYVSLSRNIVHLSPLLCSILVSSGYFRITPCNVILLLSTDLGYSVPEKLSPFLCLPNKFLCIFWLMSSISSSLKPPLTSFPPCICYTVSIISYIFTYTYIYLHIVTHRYIHIYIDGYTYVCSLWN